MIYSKCRAHSPCVSWAWLVRAKKVWTDIKLINKLKLLPVCTYAHWTSLQNWKHCARIFIFLLCSSLAFGCVLISLYISTFSTNALILYYKTWGWLSSYQATRYTCLGQSSLNWFSYSDFDLFAGLINKYNIRKNCL